MERHSVDERSARSEWLKPLVDDQASAVSDGYRSSAVRARSCQGVRRQGLRWSRAASRTCRPDRETHHAHETRTLRNKRIGEIPYEPAPGRLNPDACETNSWQR
jgi:hypothetical protein